MSFQLTSGTPQFLGGSHDSCRGSISLLAILLMFLSPLMWLLLVVVMKMMMIISALWVVIGRAVLK